MASVSRSPSVICHTIPGREGAVHRSERRLIGTVASLGRLSQRPEPVDSDCHPLRTLTRLTFADPASLAYLAVVGVTLAVAASEPLYSDVLVRR